jgi:sugar/nucleoside kinase (ribokinase family)
MARLRRDLWQDGQVHSQILQRPLRIVASGTLFVTHTLALPTHPSPSTVIRAHAVSKSRGGSASTLLSLLAQFPCVEALLVAPLAGNDEGTMILRDLEKEGVTTRYCKIWDGAGVPTAWVLHSG